MLSSIYCTYLEEMFLLRCTLEDKTSIHFEIKWFNAISNILYILPFFPPSFIYLLLKNWNADLSYLSLLYSVFTPVFLIVPSHTGGFFL